MCKLRINEKGIRQFIESLDYRLHELKIVKSKVRLDIERIKLYIKECLRKNLQNVKL